MTSNSNDNNDNGTIKLPAYLVNRHIRSINIECDKTVLHIEYDAVNIFTRKHGIGHIICSFYRNNIDKTIAAFNDKSDVLDHLTKDNRLDKSVSQAIEQYIESNWAVLRG